jgi:predicted transcriptional regulator
MAMVANDKAAAKRLGIPQSVGKDYVKADKGRNFAEGGDMKESKSMMKKEVAFMKKKGAPKSMVKHEEKEMASNTKKYSKGGSVGSASKRADGIAKKGKTKGTMVKMNKGGAC